MFASDEIKEMNKLFSNQNRDSLFAVNKAMKIKTCHWNSKYFRAYFDVNKAKWQAAFLKWNM